jgi:hypothetical protein
MRFCGDFFSATEQHIGRSGRILHERQDGVANLAIAVGSKEEGGVIEVQIGDDQSEAIIDVPASSTRTGMEARDDPLLLEALKPWYENPFDIPPDVYIFEQRLVKGANVRGRGELCPRKCWQQGDVWRLQQFAGHRTPLLELVN